MTLQEKVDAIQWWHKIDLGDGITTPGVGRVGPEPAWFHLPQSFRGQSVLDIGAWDGYYSFLAESRGAAVVCALDVWDRSKDSISSGGTREGFDLAKEVLHSNVQPVELSVYDLNPDYLYDVIQGKVGKFDVVFLFGVYYHLKHPLLALEKVRSVCKGTVYVEGFLDLINVPQAACAFYSGDQINHDPTNWTGPNVPCVLDWLTAAGFRDARLVDGVNLENWTPTRYARGMFTAKV